MSSLKGNELKYVKECIDTEWVSSAGKYFDLCGERNITIVEDARESLDTFYKEGKFEGKHTGTIGKLGCLLFNGNK